MQIETKNIDKAIEIADFSRRQRFYGTLPLGGRLLALRWILEAPEEMLGETEVLQRKDLRAKYPHYAKLSADARALRDKLTAQPLVPDGDDARKAREADLTRLGQMSLLQEVALREIALRRDPSNYVFSPVLSAREIQRRLTDKQAALVFFNTTLGTHVFAVGKDKYANWKLDTADRLARQLVTMLRDFGQYDRNTPIASSMLRDEKWRASGADVLKMLLRGVKPESLAQFDELIVVPDGALWYVPFEALGVADGAEIVPLIKKTKVRYAPTLSLGVPDASGFTVPRQTAIVAGRLYPKDDDAATTESVAALREALPGSVELPAILPGPSALVAKFAERAIVLADLDESPAGPYDWAPLALDRGKPGSTLAAWQMLPFGGPRQIVLPGFHTPAEAGLKRPGSGDEIFLSAMGLMSTGTRTILLSRWRVGGQSTQDLMRSFSQELPHTSASAAWQRSVQLLMAQEFDPLLEPRVASSSSEPPLKGEHPFFWGGYLLIDTGAAPEKP